MRRLKRAGRSVLYRAINRLDDYVHTDMSDYMKRGNDVEQPATDPWEDAPFTPTWKVEDSSDQKQELAQSNAAKIRNKVLRAGSISADENVEPAMRTLNQSHFSDDFYYLICGPVAASAKDVEWNTAFRMDLSEAPAFKSDEFKRVASGFNLTESDERNLIPKKIKSSYRYLAEVTERNNGERAVHPEELRGVGPSIIKRDARLVFDYLSDFPGVEGPDDGPAWEHVEEPEISDIYEQDSKSQSGKKAGEKP